MVYKEALANEIRHRMGDKWSLRGSVALGAYNLPPVWQSGDELYIKFMYSPIPRLPDRGGGTLYAPIASLFPWCTQVGVCLTGVMP